jgi:hypothetical protein
MMVTAAADDTPVDEAGVSFVPLSDAVRFAGCHFSF